MIDIYVATGRRRLETRQLDSKRYLKVKAIVSARDYHGGLPFPLPDVFGMAGGNADIAICIRNDGIEIPVVVPKGQQWMAQALIA